MANLQSLLQRAVQRRLRGGGAVSVELNNDLRAYRSHQFWIFVSIEALTVFAVAACAYFLATNPKETVALKALTGLIGIGAGGVVEVMRRIWKEWSQTDLLLVLISEASEAQVTSMVDKLIARI
jgi:hypothetical protein